MIFKSNFQNVKNIKLYALLMLFLGTVALSAIFFHLYKRSLGFIHKNDTLDSLSSLDSLDNNEKNNFFYFQPSPSKQIIDANIVTKTGTQPFVELLKGRWSLVFFGYTFCPDICPLSMKIMANILKQMQIEQKKHPIQALFISVDPARDNTERLENFHATYKTSNLFAFTSTEIELNKIMSALQTTYLHEKKSTSDENYTVQHPSGFYLFSPLGEYMGRFTGTNQTEQIKKELIDFLNANVYPSIDNLRLEFDSHSEMGVGYFEVQGSNLQDYILIRVSSNDTAIDMHESLEVDGMHKMEHLHEIKIPKSSQIIFAPGGKHLMLTEMKNAENLNNEIELKFEFSSGLYLNYRAKLITQ